MAETSLSFDHVHLVSTDPQATARWYADTLGGAIGKSGEVQGAPQIYVSWGSAMIIVCGQRPGENPAGKPGLQWGIHHFGLQVTGDFDAFCAGLRDRGVKFTKDPTQANPTTRIAFVQAPDGVSVELLQRSNQA